MQIHDLSHHPHAIAQLAGWHFDQWSHLYPNMTQHCFVQELQQSLAGGTIPRTWVVSDSEQVRGSASVVEQDMHTHPELGPWLASVYVHEQLRGQGVGSKLIRTVMQDCAQSGLKELYLFTPGQENFYRSLGWKTLRQEEYQGESVSIMHYTF